MKSSDIQPGDMLECRTAFGEHIWMKALGLCRRGHAMTESNVVTSKRGRCCRMRKDATNREWRRRVRENG